MLELETRHVALADQSRDRTDAKGSLELIIVKINTDIIGGVDVNAIDPADYAGDPAALQDLAQHIVYGESGDPEDPEVFRINLKDIMTKGRVDLNLFLAQNDVVYVPPNRWARIGFAVDNVLFPFTSASSAATTYLAFQQLGGNEDNGN